MTQPLTSRTAVGYAVGDFGINLYFISAMTWLLFFYTDVLGISATAAAGVFFVARLVDALTDPLMGAIAERTRSRWGRLRPYLLFGAIPLALITVLTFTVPDLDNTGKVIWAYVTYTLFGIFYTIVTIPYSALTASLTDDYAARTRLSTYRIGCAFAGGFLASVATFPFIGLYEDPAQGFQQLMLVFGVIATGLLWFTFANTREVVTPVVQQSLTLKDSARAVAGNAPLWVVIGMFSCGMLGFTVRQSATAYFFTYNVGQPNLTATYFGTTLAVMLVGIWLVPHLSARWGKAGAMRYGAYLVIAGCAAFYFYPTVIDYLGCLSGGV